MPWKIFYQQLADKLKELSYNVTPNDFNIEITLNAGKAIVLIPEYSDYFHIELYSKDDLKIGIIDTYVSMEFDDVDYLSFAVNRIIEHKVV